MLKIMMISTKFQNKAWKEKIQDYSTKSPSSIAQKDSCRLVGSPLVSADKVFWKLSTRKAIIGGWKS